MLFKFKLISDFFGLIYPNTCAACGNNLYKNENIICTKCIYELPKTNYYKETGNPVEQIFWGRVNIERACSYYFFHKGSKFRKLIHKLKYKGQKEIGYEIGRHFGSELIGSDFINVIDVIVPVPIHPSRKRHRGYNQSDWIGMGLSESLDIPLDTKSFYRNVATETQTKKSRFERWKNVENVFSVKDEAAFLNKHILLIDDVLTTGATLEACANSLLKINGVKVSIATLAVTQM